MFKDELYDEVKNFILNGDKVKKDDGLIRVSSEIMRRFRIGYMRSCNIVYDLVDAGILVDPYIKIEIAVRTNDIKRYVDD